MGKNTFGKTMPRALSQNLKIMGEQIMLARKRRHLSMQDIADRATVTRLTVSKVEHGDPTVSMGIYARVLFALNLENIFNGLVFYRYNLIFWFVFQLILLIPGLIFFS